MRHLTLRLVIALLTFVIGVVISSVWIISHKSPAQKSVVLQKDSPAIQIAQTEQRECGHSNDPQSYIDALACSSDLQVVYGDDGAADATVMEAKETTAPEVRSIVELGSQAIPLLIRHLDDRRLTSATFHTYEGRTQKIIQVPVGHICLDILTHITNAPKIFADECGDDGLGACIDSKFYFRPDDYHLEGENLKWNAIAHTAKINWQNAYKKGWVKFSYPTWWK